MAGASAAGHGVGLHMANMSRRTFLKGAGASTLTAPLLAQAPSPPEATGTDAVPAGATVPLRLTINGQAHDLQVRSDQSLADVIRDQAGLTGTKVACGHGSCGACKVLMDGRPDFD